MNRRSIRAWIVMAAVAIPVAGTATAQVIGSVPNGVTSPGAPCLFGGCAATNQGSYGPAFFAPNKNMSHRPCGDQPYCATETYPKSDWAYIRKYCGPTIIPGSCYGHFQTKWRKWEDHCPGSADPLTDVPPPAPGGVGVDLNPQPIPPQPLPKQPEAPKTETPKAPASESLPAPKSTPPGGTTIPMPLPKPMEPGELPKIPVVPKKISGEIQTGSETPPVPMPVSEPARVIVPPLPELPMKR